MQLKELQLLFHSGNLKGCDVVRAPLSPGKWSISCNRKNDVPVMLMAQRGNVREFSGLDSALKLVMEIGFNRFTVTV